MNNNKKEKKKKNQIIYDKLIFFYNNYLKRIAWVHLQNFFILYVQSTLHVPLIAIK